MNSKQLRGKQRWCALENSVYKRDSASHSNEDTQESEILVNSLNKIVLWNVKVEILHKILHIHTSDQVIYVIIKFHFHHVNIICQIDS